MGRISAKVGFILLNGFLLLTALALIITGALVQGSLNKTPSLLNQHLSIPVSVTTAFGVLLFCVSSFAHVSVFCQSHKMLIVYAFLLIGLILAEIAVGVTGFVTSFHVLRLIDNTLRSAEAKYTSDTLAGRTWDGLQQDLHCCGVRNYTEWFPYLGHSAVPDSCCISYTASCGRDALTTKNLYLNTCAVAIQKWVHRHELLAAIIFPVLVFVKFITVFVTYEHHRILRSKTHARLA